MKKSTFLIINVLLLLGIVLICFACQENEQPQGGNVQSTT